MSDADGPGTDGTGPGGLHASAVAFGARAVLIRGASGSGKSALALALLSRRLFDGTPARLVADDRVCLQRRGAALIALAPDALRGLIEVRGTGLLRVPFASSAPLALVIDLCPAGAPSERLPDPCHAELVGCRFPLVRLAAREAASAADLAVALLSGAELVNPEAGP